MSHCSAMAQVGPPDVLGAANVPQLDLAVHRARQQQMPRARVELDALDALCVASVLVDQLSVGDVASVVAGGSVRSKALRTNKERQKEGKNEREGKKKPSSTEVPPLLPAPAPTHLWRLNP